MPSAVALPLHLFFSPLFSLPLPLAARRHHHALPLSLTQDNDAGTSPGRGVIKLGRARQDAKLAIAQIPLSCDFTRHPHPQNTPKQNMVNQIASLTRQVASAEVSTEVEPAASLPRCAAHARRCRRARCPATAAVQTRAPRRREADHMHPHSPCGIKFYAPATS